MPVDALAKRFFPAIVLAMIALAAYFQASGVMQLVAGAYLEDAKAPSEPAGKATKHPVAAAEPQGPRTAEPILSRNPFDSTTGPLNKSPETEATGGQPAQADLSNPLAAPDCGGIQAHVITESTDPTWSVAVLQAPGEPLGKMRRVGDAVADKQVAYIGYNPVKNSPSVWLLNNAQLCQVLLFAQAAPAAPSAAPAASAAPETPASSGGVPADIADKIKKVSDTEFHIDRSVVDKILEDQAQLMRSARIVPEQKNGKVVGIRLFGVRPDTLLGKLGLQNGDRLESINGFEMASPEKALEAYAHLRTSDNLSVKVTRRGQPVNIDFKIQ